MTLQIDRIEDEVAVLVLDGRPFEVPRSLLPPDAREGDTLRWSLTVDREATEAARQRVMERRARLSRDDDGGDFSL